MSILETPAERRRLKVREEILEAAERVFAREGAEGLSIRRLARKVDYSPAAIYKYFGSKEALVDQLKETFFALLLENVHLMADTTRPFPARARECVAAYMHIAAQKPFHYGAAFAGQRLTATPDDGDPAFSQSNKGRAFLVLKGLVEEGIASGYFRANLDPALAAKSMWAGMHGLAMMIAHIPTFPAFRPDAHTISTETFINMHADLLVRGLETADEQQPRS